jgi:hypothetical protein
MPIVAKSSGASFTPAPEGAHAAVCVDVVDLGVVETTWNKQTKKKHMVRIYWQIDEDRDDGKPFLVQRRYTLSLHEKAGLRKDLESWRGRAFTETELDGFDVETVIGVPCLLNLVHTKKDGTIYANIVSIMKLPKSMQAPAMRDYIRVIDREPAQGEAVGPNWGEIDDTDLPF